MRTTHGTTPTSTLTLRHFAAARDLAGTDSEQLEWQDGTTVAQLRKILAKRGGKWQHLARHSRFARDDEFLFEAEELYSGEEILVLPPAAGGSPRATLQHTPIAPGATEQALTLVGVGGIATFVGTVRDHNLGKAITQLEYTAYEPMAQKEMERICGEAIERFGLGDVRVIHRLGVLQVGEVAVSIACGAAHRKAAFDACQFVIDELKARVPIWKKETSADGSEWLNSTP
ncbi:MAG: molybdenum cofactor biosynthesis protein MoaE [Deltaproteobacteria bacterium]|nr:molybdenum cofactor biosynthesis protein MoaE [Deltaproteobacteria bacterium]